MAGPIRVNVTNNIRKAMEVGRRGAMQKHEQQLK
jgi:hypothetical protein